MLLRALDSGPHRSSTLVGGSLEGDRETSFSRHEPEVIEAAAPVTLEEDAEPVAVELTEPRPWPSFRGPNGSGIADGQGAPLRWSGEGRSVLWKTAIPGLGHSGPIVWGERIFLTSAVTEEGDNSLRIGLYGDVDSVEDDSVHVWKIFAVDRSSGEIVWERTAASGRPRVKRHLKSTHANPSPATDGEHLVVSFGSEGLFCYGFDGTLHWKKDLGLLSSGWFFDGTYEWGFSSSPILHDGRVIVQVDVSKGSFVGAFDLETGEEIWRTPRNEPPGYATPNVLPGGDGPDEIVTNGKTIRGYDAASGEELWSLAPNSELTVASPTVEGGVAFVTGGYPPVRPIYAIAPGGRGDLTLAEGESAGGAVTWSHDRGGTYMPTPLAYRGLLYVLQNNGRLSTYDLATGELIYRHRVGQAGSYTASPVAADERLYLTNEEGTTYVVRAGRSYGELAQNSLGEIVMATPAISGGMMVVRSKEHLWALGEESAESPHPSGGGR